MGLYSTGFFITKPESNNRFDYAVRTSPTLYVPDVMLGSLDDVQIGAHTAIEAKVGDLIRSEKGLQHFISLRNARVPTWICDNHNHAFAFWHEALMKGYIRTGSTLIHIDQHTDLGTPLVLPMKNEEGKMKNRRFAVANEGMCGFENLEEVEKYTNTVLTIADFIVPALSTGLISEALMVTGEDRTGAGTFIWKDNQIMKTQNSELLTRNSVIVDLDLDYFAQGFDDKIIGENVRFWLAKADIVTIATSPLFIEQEKALTILKSLQKELILL